MVGKRGDGLEVNEAVIGLLSGSGKFAGVSDRGTAAYRKEGDMVVEILLDRIFLIFSVYWVAALATPIPFGPDTGVNWIDVAR